MYMSTCRNQKLMFTLGKNICSHITKCKDLKDMDNILALKKQN